MTLFVLLFVNHNVVCILTLINAHRTVAYQPHLRSCRRRRCRNSQLHRRVQASISLWTPCAPRISLQARRCVVLRFAWHIYSTERQNHMFKLYTLRNEHAYYTHYGTCTSIHDSTMLVLWSGYYYCTYTYVVTPLTHVAQLFWGGGLELHHEWLNRIFCAFSSSSKLRIWTRSNFYDSRGPEWT